MEQRCGRQRLFLPNPGAFRMRHMSLFLIILWVAGTGNLRGQEASDQLASEAAIRKAAKLYVEAFNKHDAEAVAEHWSPEAVYLNCITGEEVVGRAAIVKQFAALFKEQPQSKLEVTVTSVQFVSPNVAIEHGTARTLAPNGQPEETEYSAVNVKRDGKWLLDRVTDKAKEETPGHYEKLKSLEWMVGSWSDEADDTEVELDCNWTKNKNFMTRAFKISIDGQVDVSGMQVIGWDPAAKAIRSWTFDSNGAFAEATWELRKDRWFIRNRGVLPDGRSASMINVMKQVDENSLTWQTIERTAGEELLPNIDEIQLVRR
jgi:uncharacterized protein (TIGR02246 family)